MDNFIRLHMLYRSVTRWSVVVQIYRHAAFQWKLGMWAGKVLFALFAVVQYFVKSPLPYFCAILSAILWAWSFDHSRRLEFADEYRRHPRRLEYFGYDYQYVRYLRFRDLLEDLPVSSIGGALSFMDGLINSDSRMWVASHRFISIFSAVALAILGGAAGQWPAKYIVGTLLVLLLCLFLSYVILDTSKNRLSNMMEFKRFLLWARDEQLQS